MIFPVYECPECGSTWRVSLERRMASEEDDIKGIDEVTECLVCMECGSIVIRQLKDENGKPLYHHITDEELEEEDKKDGVMTSLDESYLNDDDLNYIPDYYYDE